METRGTLTPQKLTCGSNLKEGDSDEPKALSPERTEETSVHVFLSLFKILLIHTANAIERLYNFHLCLV